MCVSVLLQHDVAGGCTHTFEEKGFEFDTGLHYIGGQLNKKNSPLRKLFDTITDSGLQWAPTADDFDVVCLGDKQPFGICSDVEKLRARLKARFPTEHAAIDTYIKMAKRALVTSGLWWASRVLPLWLDNLIGWLLKLPFRSMMETSVEEALSKITKNKELKLTLQYCWGDYGTDPAKAPMGLHLLVANHYMGGAFYPVGGSSQIALHIVQVIESLGGQVLVRAPVENIIIENGAAVGVVCKGTEIRAPKIISSAGVFNTYAKLVPAADRKPLAPYIEKMGYSEDCPVRPAPGHATLFLGLNDPDNELKAKLPASNFWCFPSSTESHGDGIRRWYADSDMTGTEMCAAFIAFPSVKDPTFAKRFPGKQTAEVLTELNYEWVKDWNEARVRHRGEDYEAIKAKVTKKLKDRLFKQFPDLAKPGVIAYEELGTPLSNNFYIGAHRVTQTAVLLQGSPTQRSVISVPD